MPKKGSVVKTVLCPKCEREIAEYQQHKHYGSKTCKKLNNLRPVPEGELNCIFCNKLCKSVNSIRQHEKRCKCNPNRIDVSDVCGRSSGKGARENQFTKAKKLGLPKPTMSAESIQKGLDTRRSNGKMKHTDETRKKISESMKAAVKRNPGSYSSSNVCGRVKIQYYNGQKFHGGWEVLIAKHLDYMMVKWIRNSNSFEYVYKGKTHLYFPDFYLPDNDMYIEIKGYEVEKDRCKWSVLSNLIVLKLVEITEIKKNNICTKLKNNLIY